MLQPARTWFRTKRQKSCNEPFSGVSGLSGTFRPLRGDEKSAFRDLLLRLDPESRRNRFAMTVDDSFLVSYAETSFAQSPVIFGYFEDGVLRGTAELRTLPEPHMAEAAFCVEKGWRRNGVGTRLMDALLNEARDLQIEHIYISCLAANHTMQALARKFAARLTYQSGDMIGLIKAPKARMKDWIRNNVARTLFQPRRLASAASGQQS
ncbi:GNAT family N-acetyltransferase [Roseibium aggregatum]|uniref:GNAT family N-acetyltransferase n=1 Tax=Roseibium aggregatum TaxID=187304 RepID=A0A926P5F5_9HYPH|nr:GNAT family N-acetyltransferase [Roseibium aggregatum]MBD1547697.1 GNAT family N-acetyltransferase [Roseibium aggregatum]